ncbi:MAG: hypothetical protein R6W83_11290 [Cryobacterium sp.]
MHLATAAVVLSITTMGVSLVIFGGYAVPGPTLAFLSGVPLTLFPPFSAVATIGFVGGAISAALSVLAAIVSRGTVLALPVVALGSSLLAVLLAVLLYP